MHETTSRSPLRALALAAAALTLPGCWPNQTEPLPTQPPGLPNTSPEGEPEPEGPVWSETPTPETASGTEAVVLSADHRFVASLSQGPGGRCLTVADLETLEVWRRADLCALRALAAGAPGQLLALSADGTALWGVDLLARSAQHVYTSPQTFTSLTVSADGYQAALANVPQSPAQLAAWEADLLALPLRAVHLVDVPTGNATALSAPYAVRDLDFSPTQLVVTTAYWNHLGLPRTVLQLVARDGHQLQTELEFPNCADDLRLQPGGTLAALGPRTCHLRDVVLAEPEVTEPWQTWSDVPPPVDPISLVDLAAGQHLGNVPGFGPVEWSPDGTRLVGFTDRQTLMVEWNTFVTAPFGLVVVDAATLDWQLTDVGDARPEYRFSPEGDAVFVRSAASFVPFAARLDLATGLLTKLGGPPVGLGQAARLTGDPDLYVADASALHRLSPSGPAVVALAPGLTGDHLLASPDDGLLILTDRVAGAHHLLSPWFDEPPLTLPLPGPILGN